MENWGSTELVLAELDGERAGVVLDRRDVVDRLAEAFAEEPVEGLTLDVDQVGEVENVLETGKRLARARRSDRLGQGEQPPLRALRVRANDGKSEERQADSGQTVGVSANLPG